MTRKSSQKKKAAASALGKLGGKAYLKKYGKRRMAELGKKGAKARWAKN